MTIPPCPKCGEMWSAIECEVEGMARMLYDEHGQYSETNEDHVKHSPNVRRIVCVECESPRDDLTFKGTHIVVKE